jgi:hypothetical protein
MSGSRDMRLAKLERRRPAAGGIVLVWCLEDETSEEAIARDFPDGVPPGVQPRIIRWLRPGETAPSPG